MAFTTQGLVNLEGQEWPKFSSSSERIAYPAPLIIRERVNFPPGTRYGSLGDSIEAEDLSDHDIAAGRISKSTRTAVP